MMLVLLSRGRFVLSSISDSVFQCIKNCIKNIDLPSHLAFEIAYFNLIQEAQYLFMECHLLYY